MWWISCESDLNKTESRKWTLFSLLLEWWRRGWGGRGRRRRGAAGERRAQRRSARWQNQGKCGRVRRSVCDWWVFFVIFCRLDGVLITKSVNVFVLYQLLGKVSIHCFFLKSHQLNWFSLKNPFADGNEVVIFIWVTLLCLFLFVVHPKL